MCGRSFPIGNVSLVCGASPSLPFCTFLTVSTVGLCVGSCGCMMNIQRCVIKVIQEETDLLSPLLSDGSGRRTGQTHIWRGYDYLFLVEACIYIPFLSSMVKLGMESQLKRLVFRYYVRVIDQTFSVFIIFFFRLEVDFM